MATITHIEVLEMQRNNIDNVSFRLRADETLNVSQFKSELKVTFEYYNSSNSMVTQLPYVIEIKLNGKSVITIDTTNYINKPNLKTEGWHVLHEYSEILSHNSDGGGNFSASVEFKANPLLGYFRTYGTASINRNLTNIDLSVPTLSGISVSADRYGRNAAAKFTASHASYNLTKVRFELKGLTEAQAKNRVGKSTQANTSSYVYDSSRNAYTLILEKTSNLSTSNTITFDLDCVDETSYPLNSGKTYEYGIILTALNGKTLTKAERFTVPQKVTGVTCDSVINIMQGGTAQLSYAVLPTNAQLQTVKFTSSDTAIATVDSNGLITAKETSDSFRTAVITVKTDDGNFTAKCTVNVTTTEPFPAIYPGSQYLSAELFSKIISATAVVYSELADAGATLSSLSGVTISGRDEPVINIMPAFRKVEADCQKLRAAASAIGLSTDPLPSTVQTINKQNTNWIIVVNNWINFLNNLHNQLGGG